ncbi:MAG: hypothetical protein COB66_05705 [Coxiella sp. (in: Bacteria)]|nr:MAG: hypothetical protein COB66_05705 [Coxiella sp. (in: g-proteobacteria)]
MSKPGYSLEQRVYFEDTDATGVVYHSNYLCYMERARSEWLWAVGHSFDDCTQRNIAFAIHHASLDYLYPARLGDKLLITCNVDNYRRTSITFDQSVKNADNNDIVYCQGKIRLVCITLKGKPQPFPADFLEKLS